MSTKYAIKKCLDGSLVYDQTVTVTGWVKTKRDSKAGISFINIYDGSCFDPIQLVASNNLNNYISEILHLVAGCSVIATGKLVASQGKGQQCEIQVDCLEVVGWVENPETYPIQPKHHTLEYLREVAHLRPRTNIIGAVMRVRHCLARAIHNFFHERGFLWIHTPIITSIDCEGAGELFHVNTGECAAQSDKSFFGQETFLTVSGQLNAEAYCLAMSKVYTFGPTFRAENSNTSRHLAEFWMVEPEIAFANLDDIIQLSQDMLRFLLHTVLEERADDMHFFNQTLDNNCISRLQHVIDTSFEMMSYTDAIYALEKSDKNFTFPVKWGLDLQSEHERYLAEELCNKPVVVINYPKQIKGFYMRLNADGRTVAAMDVLAPGIGEIIGGSQREDRLAVLTQRMDECKLDQIRYKWYLDLRRYGSVPHAGFGLGLERLLGYVTGVSNVRDLIPFPRTPGHAEY